MILVKYKFTIKLLIYVFYLWWAINY